MHLADVDGEIALLRGPCVSSCSRLDARPPPDFLLRHLRIPNDISIPVFLIWSVSSVPFEKKRKAAEKTPLLRKKGALGAAGACHREPGEGRALGPRGIRLGLRASGALAFVALGFLVSGFRVCEGAGGGR